MNKSETIAQIERSCAVCKFATPDPKLDDASEVICTIEPNKPITKVANDTCLKHELRYKNLKIIVDDDFLMEYDTENKRIPGGDKIADAVKIGDAEWQS